MKGLDVPILNLLGHCQESLLNVRSVLRRGLKEWDVQLISEFLKDPVSVAPDTQRTGHKPLQRYTQRPSCWSNRICSQREVYPRLRRHNGRSLGATA